MSSTNIKAGPGNARRSHDEERESEEATGQPAQQGVEEATDSNGSLVDQMSHGDGSLSRDDDNASAGIVGYTEEDRSANIRE